LVALRILRRRRAGHLPTMNRSISQSSVVALRPLWPLWALAVLLAVLWFGNLGLRTLTEPDEGRYAEIPREMLADGDWLAPHLNGIQYLEKPPLQYWATAALYEVLGVHPWVSRLYTAGLGFALLVLVGVAGWRWYDAATGLYAALMLGSSALFYLLAHLNTLDMGLCFYLSLAMLAFVNSQRVTVSTGTDAGTGATSRWLWLAWAALGLAVLQKGLVGLVLPGFAVALYVLWHRDWALPLRMRLLSGFAIVVALNLPWWWLMQRRNPAFLDWFFVHEHYTRFLTNEHDRAEPWWYFSALLLVGVLPWIAPMMRGFLAALRMRDPAVPGPAIPAVAKPGFATERFLAVWAAAVFIFYSPSGSKLAPYILPMLPPMALLAARFLALRPVSVPALRVTLWCAAAAGLLLSLLPLLVPRLVVAAERQAAYHNIARLAMLAGLLLLFATALAWLLARQRSRLSAVATLATGWIACLALLSNGSNQLAAWRGGATLAADVAPYLSSGAQLFCLDTFPQTTIFALAHTCTVVGAAGELEIQFDDGAPNWLPTEAFTTAWTASPTAVAIVDQSNLAKWQALASGARVAVNKPYGVVLVK
jgi:4-amino-4-deoxy-L-arabinose transferase-like glycosyltransferase